MKTNTTGYKMPQRQTTISLPKIKTGLINQSPEKKVSSPLFRRLSEEDLLSPHSHDIVKTWLSGHPEPHKRVQFARDVKNKERKIIRHPRIAFDIMDSLPDIDQHVQNIDLESFTPIPSEIKNEDESSNNHGNRLAVIASARLYRSDSNRTFSMSSATSSSMTHARQPSFFTNPPSTHDSAPSIEATASLRSSTINKDRSTNLSLLEFGSCLSEYDRRKFDEIRQHIPDEFEQLLPTLLKLGVVLWPKKLFDDPKELTPKEMRQRRRLSLIIDKDQQDSQQQRSLQRLYGSVLSHNDIHKRHTIRDNLSFQGQLSLLASYRDEIENEFNKKLKYWRSIPMKAIRTSLIEDSILINRSSNVNNTFQVKQKVHRKNTTIYRTTNEELFPLTLPDNVDVQWQRKSLVKIIEQGMNILDQARKLPHQDEDYDLKGQTAVRTFKRWLFLWSTLYTDDRCLR